MVMSDEGSDAKLHAILDQSFLFTTAIIIFIAVVTVTVIIVVITMIIMYYHYYLFFLLLLLSLLLLGVPFPGLEKHRAHPSAPRLLGLGITTRIHSCSICPCNRHCTAHKEALLSWLFFYGHELCMDVDQHTLAMDNEPLFDGAHATVRPAP